MQDNNSFPAKIVLLSGVSYSGKTKFAKSLQKQGFAVVNRDLIRLGMTGDVDDLSIEHDIIRACVDASIAHIQQGRNVVYDALNLNKAWRQQFVLTCLGLGIRLSSVHFDIKPEEIFRRMKSELHNKQAVLAQFEALQIPEYNEGFSDITIIYKTDTGMKSEILPKNIN